MRSSATILKQFEQLHPRVIDLSLDRIHRLLRALGSPEERLPRVIHVAGTNGKGSVIAMLKAIFEASGRSVHSYISPHVRTFNERISLNGAAISDDLLGKILERAQEANMGHPITFFEITTAAAFLAFSEHDADYLLLETGLGGRLDATNVIENPEISIITPVSIDHQNFLGDTIDQIAFEKAGILKAETPAVIGPQSDRALAVIERHAEQIGCRTFVSGSDWQAFEQGGRLVYQDDTGLLDLALPKLQGRHQIDNSGIAVAALRLLWNENIETRHIDAGLSKTAWPARLERLGPGVLYSVAPEACEIWLDGGHNPAAGQALAAALADLEDRVPRPLVVILGMLKNKDIVGFLQPFTGLAARVITLSIPNSPNSQTAEELRKIAQQEGFAAEASAGLIEALDGLKAQYPQSPRIVICGSLYLAGHALDVHFGEANKLAGE